MENTVETTFSSLTYSVKSSPGRWGNGPIFLCSHLIFTHTFSIYIPWSTCFNSIVLTTMCNCNYSLVCFSKADLIPEHHTHISSCVLTSPSAWASGTCSKFNIQTQNAVSSSPDWLLSHLPVINDIIALQGQSWEPQWIPGHFVSFTREDIFKNYVHMTNTDRI